MKITVRICTPRLTLRYSGKVLRKYVEPVNWMSPETTSYINSLL